MKSPRDIVIKTLLDAEEFTEFQAERKAAKVEASPLIRAFLNSWTAEQKHKRAQQSREWPAYGQHMAMSLPGRSARPILRMRL